MARRKARQDATLAAVAAIRGEDGVAAQPRKKHRWEADGVSPDGLTSMNVLLAWLTTPGNAARWHAQRRKVHLCEEVVAAMLDEGLQHRKVRDVYVKIVSMKKQFEDAHAWLRYKGFLEEYTNGTGTQHTEDRVQQMCPHYRELVPVFGSDVAAGEEVVDAAEQDSDASGELEASIAVQEQSDGEDTVGEESQAGSESDADDPEEGDEDEKVVPFASKPAHVRNQTVRNSTPRTRKARKAALRSTAAAAKRPRTTPQACSPQGGIEDIEREALLKRVEEEQLHRVEMFEIERAKARCELQIKRVEMVGEKALMRKKLVDAGVDLHEVDRLVPL